MSRVIIVKTGSTVETIRQTRGDFEQWIAAKAGFSKDEIEVVSVYESEALPELSEAVRGIIITGSSAMVSECEPWSEQSAQWLKARANTKLPILGICYGHQLLAHALGGKVGSNPKGREIGSVQITSTELGRCDPLLTGLGSDFWMQATHRESVLELPPKAVCLASNDKDAHQAFRMDDHIWGVQFHPEFDAEIIRAYIEARQEVLLQEGLDPSALSTQAKDSESGQKLLQAFRKML
ncbi:MAG: glutamine amidotransferase [Myxococcales bacterium]|nr:MAG: glutamine amidotransferase [Myxococcales bacterium]